MTIAQKLTLNFVIMVLLIAGAAATMIVISSDYARRLDAMYRDHVLNRARMSTPASVETAAAFEKHSALQDDIARREMDGAVREAYYTRVVLLAVFAVLLAATAIMALIAWRMLRPLIRLRRDADATMREVFGEAVQGEGKDEVEALVSTFDHMKGRFVSHTNELTRTREELDKQRQGLEQTVAERTRELSYVFKGVEQQAKEATLLYQMGDRLQSCQTLEEAAEVVTLCGADLFPGYACALYVTRGSKNLLEPMLTGNVPGLDRSFQSEECWALRRGKLHRVDDARREVICGHLLRPMERSYICVPLMATGEAVGLLHLQYFGDSERHDAFVTEKRAVAAAGQIALAVANLRLRETLKDLALKDPLTGLYNRRFLDETLERETARAQRRNLPLSVLMCDVDHFKRFNDEYGHEAGDVALKAVAHLMCSHFRVSDYVCRYGGEEFTVIMPEAPLDHARQRAEGFRAAAAGLALMHGGRALRRITVSLGLATLPDSGAKPDALLQAADGALYKAKEGGRDRLVVANA